MSKCSAATNSSFCFLAIDTAFISVLDAFCEIICVLPSTLENLSSDLLFNPLSISISTSSLLNKKGTTLRSTSSSP